MLNGYTGKSLEMMNQKKKLPHYLLSSTSLAKVTGITGITFLDHSIE